MALILLSPGTGKRTYVNGCDGLLGSTAVWLLIQSVFHRTCVGEPLVFLLGAAEPGVDILRAILKKKSNRTGVVSAYTTSTQTARQQHRYCASIVVVALSVHAVEVRS